MKLSAILYMLLVLATAGPPAAAAESPMDTLRVPVDQGLEILRDTSYQGESERALQRNKMWEIIKGAFDFEEVARRALAANWRDFSDEEQAAFTDVFSQMLGNTYIGKLQGEYSDETVEYLTQDMVSDRKAVVKTNILRRNMKIPVDYSMILRNGRWWVYDVHVEGVSLVLNYRSQFRKLLSGETPAQLIERLRKKVQEQTGQAAAE